MDILGFVETPLWFLLLVFTLLLLYIYGTWNFSVWTSQGVAGPKPWPLTGNLCEIVSKTQFDVYGEYQRKYGRVFGVFFGVQPVLVVSEISMIKEVLVKHFHNFSHRNFFNDQRPKEIDSSLFFAGGTVWSRIRKLMSPAFTTSKLKRMSHHIKSCTHLLSKSLEQKTQEGRVIGLQDLYGSYTMDVIAGTAFGLETNSQTEEGDPFVMHMKGLVNLIIQQTSVVRIFIFMNAFPFMTKVFGKLGLSFKFFKSDHAQFFCNAVSLMIEDRKNQNAHHALKRTDMLQILVDAEADPEAISDSNETSDDTNSYRRMTKEEMVGQGFIVLLGGYESVTATLQYLTYNLVQHPDVQEKIYQEIINNVNDDGPTYENVGKLKYLEAAIRETLRLFPPLPVTNRKSQNTVTINGITIPAGGGVLVPIRAVLRDPQLFRDPDQFLPERYLDENHGDMDSILSELFFGYGPRQCIGMRLALLELKFAAVTVVRKFRLVKCPDTPEELTFNKGFASAMPDVPIKVKAEFRDL